MDVSKSLLAIKDHSVDSGPFLEAVDQIRDLVAQVTQEDIPQDAREHLLKMIAAMDAQKAEFKTAFDASMAEVKKNLNESADALAVHFRDLENQIKENQRLIAHIDSIAIPEDTPATNPFHPDNLRLTLPQVMPADDQPALALLPGTDLLNKALGLGYSGAEVKQTDDSLKTRPSGNIWDNWNPLKEIKSKEQ